MKKKLICGITITVLLLILISLFLYSNKIEVQHIQPPPEVTPPDEYCNDFIGWGILNAKYNNRLYILRIGDLLEIETFYTVVVGNGDGKTYTQTADMQIYNNYNWKIGKIYQIGDKFFKFGNKMQQQKSDSLNIKISVDQINGSIVLNDYPKDLTTNFVYLSNERKNCFFWDRIDTANDSLLLYGTFIEYKSAISQTVKYKYDIKVKNILKDDTKCLDSIELQKSLIDGKILEKVIESNIYGRVKFVIKKF